MGRIAKSFVASATILFAVLVVRTGMEASFRRGCMDYLKRAAVASTTVIASQELDRALRYMEQKGLTSGSTAVVFPTPHEDIGFWYRNIKASRDELASLPSVATASEKTVILLKLRGTLVEHGDNEATIVLPQGIAFYPYNGMFAIWILIALICPLIFLLAKLIEIGRK